MSREYYIGTREGGVQIGSSFYGGDGVGRSFGFMPLQENMDDHAVLQPGNTGYGTAMLEYWDSLLEPEERIEDIYGYETTWQGLKEQLLSGEIRLSDRFVGSILVGRGSFSAAPGTDGTGHVSG